MTCYSCFILLIAIHTVFVAESARILCFYPVPFHSHQSVFHIFTEELSKQGHHLVVLTPLPNPKPVENVTFIDVHNFSYTMWEEGFSKGIQHHNSMILDPISFWNIVYQTMYPILEAQLRVPAMQALIKDPNHEFDLIIVEGVVRPALSVRARFKAPVVLLSSFYGSSDNFYTVGAAVDPIFFPDYCIDREGNLSFWDKLIVLYTAARLRWMEWQMEEVENAIIRKHFPDNITSMAELKKHVQLLLLNVHHVWDNNRPVPPSVIYLGALHLKEPKPLPQDLQTYVDLAPKGIVYMSLGSKISSSSLPKATLRALFTTFEALPYLVLWKWDGERPSKIPPNVRLEPWLPQNDLLHSGRVVVFITQCGLQSTDEAISALVPMLGLPVFADQWLNAHKYRNHGIGRFLHIDRLTSEDLKDAIAELAEQPSYRENLGRLSATMREQRTGALQRALQAVNKIIGQPQAHAHNLRSPLADVSFIQYYLLDVIVPLTLIILFILFCVVCLTVSVIRSFTGRRRPAQVKLKSH